MCIKNVWLWYHIFYNNARNIHMTLIFSIFYIIILIFSIVIHEIAHGYVAFLWGDNTAKNQGRLTLNPLSHIEWFGSVILPGILILSQAGFVFGWAKPVPYNPENLRNRRRGTLAVASAGVIVNLFIAIFFGLITRILIAKGVILTESSTYDILHTIVGLNLVLAIFNLIPLPPLDGSRILFSILGDKFQKLEYMLEKYAFVILILFVFVLWKYIAPVLFFLYTLITGQTF
jgi:Zn-dependent protease